MDVCADLTVLFMDVGADLTVLLIVLYALVQACQQ